MKKLKKLAALLLAGAMVMLLFTACGGTGISGEDTQAESMILNGLKETYGVSVQSNDAALKQVASQQIDTAVKANIGGHIINEKFAVDGISPAKEYITITAVSDYTYNGTKLEELVGLITSAPGVNVDFKEAGSWTKIGVVVKTVKGQTYVAISIQVKNAFYKS